MANEDDKISSGYKNPNGNMTIEEFEKLGDMDSLIEYLRGFKVSKDKCPPTELLCAVNNQCYYCVECWELVHDRHWY